MKSPNYLSYIVSGFFVLCMCGYVSADGSNSDIAKTLAVVPVKSGTVDQGVYRQFDRLVPELKKIAKKKVIKLECRYSGRPDREQDVENAYNLAARIEKHLRVRHKLDLDLWVSIDITPKSSKAPPVLTIAVFSDETQKLDTVLINPPTNGL